MQDASKLSNHYKFPIQVETRGLDFDLSSGRGGNTDSKQYTGGRKRQRSSNHFGPMHSSERGDAHLTAVLHQGRVCSGADTKMQSHRVHAQVKPRLLEPR